MFSNVMSEMKPVVSELVLMRAPFSALSTTELVKEMLVTLLSARCQVSMINIEATSGVKRMIYLIFLQRSRWRVHDFHYNTCYLPRCCYRW